MIELFASRADDLDVELSVRPTSQFAALLADRSIDIAIGPTPGLLPAALLYKPFLNYDVLAVVRPDHPLARHSVLAAEARLQTWLLGPSAATEDGVVPGMLRQLGVPEKHQRIFQSDAAALEQTKRIDGVALAVRFAVRTDLTAGRLVAVQGPDLRARGRWIAIALPEHSQAPATAELLRFITTPRATQAMVHGAGVKPGRFKPSVHVTLWS